MSGESNAEAAPRWAINIFIVFHAVAIIALGIPVDVPLKIPFLRAVAPYLYQVGLWQNWKMFAPLPARVNEELFAVLEWRDGRREVQQLPRGGPRLAKWSEFVTRPESAFLARDATVHVARANDPTATRLRSVTLFVRRSIVPPPGGELQPAQTIRLYSVSAP